MNGVSRSSVARYPSISPKAGLVRLNCPFGLTTTNMSSDSEKKRSRSASPRRWSVTSFVIAMRPMTSPLQRMGPTRTSQIRSDCPTAYIVSKRVPCPVRSTWRYVSRAISW